MRAGKEKWAGSMEDESRIQGEWGRGMPASKDYQEVIFWFDRSCHVDWEPRTEPQPSWPRSSVGALFDDSMHHPNNELPVVAEGQLK